MKSRQKKDTLTIVLYLAPALILFGAFILFPAGDSVFLSFQQWKGIFGAAKKFVGLSNYAAVLRDSNFWRALLNSFYFMLGGFLVLMPLSFGLALLITSNLKFTKLMKTAYFMPVMLSTTAVGLMWVYIFNPQYGAINVILKFFGMGALARDWLATPTVNVWCVILVNEWMYAGYNMLIFAAGLVAIPRELYEATRMDTDSWWKRTLYVTIPLCKESFKVFSILCWTGCLKTFDLMWTMTRGWPNRVSEMPSTLLYNEAFTYHNFGKSSAIGVILMILGVALSLSTSKALKREQ